MNLPRLVESYPVVDIVVTVPEEEAEHVARLVTAMLGMNRVAALVELRQRVGQAALSDDASNGVTDSIESRPYGAAASTANAHTLETD